MFKRKSNTPDTGSNRPTAGSGRQHKGKGVGAYFQTALLSAVLIILLCAGGIFFVQGNYHGSSGGSQLSGSAKIIAGRLADTVRFHYQVMEGFAENPRIGTLFLQEDISGLRQQETKLSKLLPSALKVRLLPKEWNEADNSSIPPLSFASLDLLRTVEKSGVSAPAEIHQFGSEYQHIALAVPVKSSTNGAVVGVLHLALPFKLITSVLKNIADPGGRVEIQQLAGGKSVTLAAVGKIDLPEAGMDGSAAVEGAIWQVGYRFSRDTGDMEEQMISLAILAVGLVLVILLLLFQSGRLKKAMRSDQAAVINMAENLMAGGSGGPAAKAQLAEFQGLLELLRRTGLGGGRKRQQSVVADGKSADPGGTPSKISVLEDVEATDAYASSTMASGTGGDIPETIFRANDIRGIVGETLTDEIMFDLGRAIGSQAYEQGQQTIIVARDGRDSGKSLGQTLCKGMMASGRDVVNIGMVPTPLLYFATHFLGSNTGVMVTGGHNPPEYNGLKIVIAGETLAGEALHGLQGRIGRGDLLQGNGTQQEQDLLPDYINRVMGDVQLARPLKLVIDCRHGVAGLVAPALFQALGCNVINLHTQVDGSLSNQYEDLEKTEYLAVLIKSVKENHADLGVVFDGDGDRLLVVDPNGEVIWSDRLLMLLAKDVLMRQPGADVIYDVDSSRHLAPEILAAGGRPIMWKSGHAQIKAKMKQTGALLAGGMSGHIFFKERWYGFDDGLYCCARLLEILSAEVLDAADLFAGLPESASTSLLTMACGEEGASAALMERLIAQGGFGDAKVIELDGLRAEFEDGWGIVRASSATPSLMFRFEADTPDAVERIKGIFRQQMMSIDPGLKLPF